MAHHQDFVIDVLRDPRVVLGRDLRWWDRVIRDSRRADVLPRVAAHILQAGLNAQVPAAPAAHLAAAGILARAQVAEVLREVEHVRACLVPIGVEPILLKGAAYVVAGLPPMEGRLFSDIDILVPRQRIAEVEAALMLQGWATTHHSDYDQRYYRVWMHELPPMQHIHRHTTLDVHHGILPETARRRPDPGLLIASSHPVRTAQGTVRVLAPADMILHSMAHLFFNEEHSHALRDLSDIDLLIRHFAVDEAFWLGLMQRAGELDLGRTLYYGLRYARSVIGTPVPEAILERSTSHAPAWPLAPLMDALWRRIFRTPPSGRGLVPRQAAQFCLYVRAHWLRMPPLLLARHLTVKAFMRATDKDTAAA